MKTIMRNHGRIRTFSGTHKTVCRNTPLTEQKGDISAVSYVDLEGIKCIDEGNEMKGELSICYGTDGIVKP